MQTNIARAADYDQPHAAGVARSTILVVDDDTTARLTISAVISLCTDQRPRTAGDALRRRPDAPAISET
jgi:hypothetical protein